MLCPFENSPEHFAPGVMPFTAYSDGWQPKLADVHLELAWVGFRALQHGPHVAAKHFREPRHRPKRDVHRTCLDARYIVLAEVAEVSEFRLRETCLPPSNFDATPKGSLQLLGKLPVLLTLERINRFPRHLTIIQAAYVGLDDYSSFRLHVAAAKGWAARFPWSGLILLAHLVNRYDRNGSVSAGAGDGGPSRRDR